MTVNTSLIIGFVLFAATLIFGRVLSEQALKKIPKSRKTALVDAFSRYRVFSMIPLVLLLLAAWAAMKYRFLSSWGLVVGVIAALLVYIVASNVIIFKKMRRLDVPATYLRLYIISRGIQHVGLVALLAIILFGM